jgi:hypothetical protein
VEACDSTTEAYAWGRNRRPATVAAQVAPWHHLRRATSSTRCWPVGEAQRERQRAAEQAGGGRIGSAAARVPGSRASARGQQDQIEPERVVDHDEADQKPHLAGAGEDRAGRGSPGSAGSDSGRCRGRAERREGVRALPAVGLTLGRTEPRG